MAGRRWPAWPTTVRVRLTGLAALVVGAGLAAGGAAVLILVWQNLMTNAQEEAWQRARDTVALIAAVEPPRTLPSAGDDAAVVQVVDRRGRVLAASEELLGRGPLLSSWPEGGMLTATLRDVAVSDETGDYAVVGLPADWAGDPVAVYAASPLEQVHEAMAATGAALAVVIPALLVVATGTAWLLVGRALRPVEAMRQEVAEITATELDRRVPEPALRDELGRLARTMNEMLSRLQHAHERQRGFVADASHELRSPLASIRTRLEVGLAHPANADWVRLARSVHREGARLEHLVDELLLLSCLERPQEDLRVDLDELVLIEVEAMRARGTVTVELAPFSAARLAGRPNQLRLVVRNLLDNAERHALRTVVVSLSTNDGNAELVVADDGDGIPQAHRERVFERFFRLQPARDRDSGGAGLGLAIVRDVAASHGGESWLAATAVGAEFHVRLPLAPS